MFRTQQWLNIMFDVINILNTLAMLTRVPFALIARKLFDLFQQPYSQVSVLKTGAIEKGEHFIGCGELLFQKDCRSVEEGLLLVWELLEFLCKGHHLQSIVSSGPFVLFESEGKVIVVVVDGKGKIVQLVPL